MPLKRLIFLVNFYTFCIGTIFILPVFVLYYQDVLGLGFRELMIGEAIFAAVIIMMEIPSGWLSDVWSRRGTLMVGTFFGAVGFGCMAMAQDLWLMLLGQAILGISVACNSGTVTSLLYDALKEKGKEHLYRRLESKRHAMGLYAVAIGAVVGGFIYQYDPHLPLVLDIVTCLMACVVAFSLVEPKRTKRAAEKNPFYDMMVTIKYALHGHKEIGGIIIVSTILFCTTKMVMWTQQPYMQYVEIPTEYFGYIIACGFLFGGVVGHFGHYVPHHLSNRQMMTCLACVTMALITAAALCPVQPSILLILAVSGIWGFGFPFVQNAINKHADETRRATILSTLGLLVSLSFIPASTVLGFVEEAYSIVNALLYLAIQLLVIGVIGLFIWWRGVQRHECQKVL